MKLLLGCLLAFISLCSAFDFQSTESVDVQSDWINQQSCCPLKWISVEDEHLWKDVINITAYKLLHVSGQKAEVLSERPMQFFAFNNSGNLQFSLTFLNLNELGPLTRHHLVLANPNNCSLKWIKVDELQSRKMKHRHLYLPTVENVAFSQSVWNVYDNSSKANQTLRIERRLSQFYDIRQNNSRAADWNEAFCDRIYEFNEQICQIENHYLLHVDCKESLRDILTAELQSIQLNETSLLMNSKKVEASSVKVTNVYDHSVTYMFSAYESVPIRFDLDLNDFKIPFKDYLKMEANYKSFKEKNSGSLLRFIYSSPQANSFLPALNSEGEFSSGPSASSQAIFSRQIEVPASSKCKVSAFITSFDGQEPVEVSFVVRTSTDRSNLWTNDRILSFLQSSQVQTNQLAKKDGELLFKFSGDLVVSSFVEDKVEVKCEKITKE